MTNDLYSITEFRANIYGMIDHVLETGESILLKRHNEVIEVRKKSTRTKPTKKRDLSKIVPMECMVEDPDWYISPKLHEWSGEIDPNLR